MISRIETINRFLASVKALETGGWANSTDTEEYYKTQYVYPIRDVFDNARSFCVSVKFIDSKEGKLRLTKNGQVYLNLGAKKNNEFLLEPNARQIAFLRDNIFLVAPLLDLIKELLYPFYRDENNGLRLPKEEILVIEDQNLLTLLLQLGVLKDEKNFVVLVGRYAKLFESIIFHAFRIITPEDFEKSQEEKKVVAKIAENYALEYERSRLGAAKAQKQADLVDYIAIRNVAAGYDILSFNDKDSKTYDRFVEVKAGRVNQINFFLSRHEFEIAEKLKDKYWIYYIHMQNNEPKGIKLFNNPINSIVKNSKFDTLTDIYEISEK